MDIGLPFCFMALLWISLSTVCVTCDLLVILLSWSWTDKCGCFNRNMKQQDHDQSLTTPQADVFTLCWTIFPVITHLASSWFKEIDSPKQTSHFEGASASYIQVKQMTRPTEFFEKTNTHNTHVCPKIWSVKKLAFQVLTNSKPSKQHTKTHTYIHGPFISYKAWTPMNNQGAATLLFGVCTQCQTILVVHLTVWSGLLDLPQTKYFSHSTQFCTSETFSQSSTQNTLSVWNLLLKLRIYRTQFVLQFISG